MKRRPKWDVAQAFAKHLGIRMLDREPARHGQDYGAVWNGRTMFTGEFTTSDLLHEVAHWMVAEPEQRAMVNYGLGPDWTGGGGYAPEVPTSEKQELLASVLGIIMEFCLRLPWEDTLTLHSWVWRDQWDPAFSVSCQAVTAEVEIFQDWLASRG